MEYMRLREVKLFYSVLIYFLDSYATLRQWIPLSTFLSIQLQKFVFFVCLHVLRPIPDGAHVSFDYYFFLFTFVYFDTEMFPGVLNLIENCFQVSWIWTLRLQQFWLPYRFFCFVFLIKLYVTRGKDIRIRTADKACWFFQIHTSPWSGQHDKLHLQKNMNKKASPASCWLCTLQRRQQGCQPMTSTFLHASVLAPGQVWKVNCTER